MLNDLKEIEHSLEQLSKELDSQLSAYSSDADKFHENLINLLSKFPDDKELIQFIVFINDRIVTSHTISRDILYETVKGIIKQKQYLLKRLIKEYEIKSVTEESKIVKLFEFIKTNKTTLIIITLSLAFSLTMVSLLTVPKETIETINILKGLAK